MAKQLADPNYSVVYQIYPSSFQDSNGDGFGDLNGVTSRLDYLAALGIDYIWLSPFFPSPQADCGYDVSNYRDVDPRYGTLEDFRRMTRRARELGIGVVIDLVMNHTSIEHPWFKEALLSPDSPKRAHYTWTDKPNNWRSMFGKSAWTKDRASGQYYLHTFLPQQPDLNWDNPKVREEFIGPDGIIEFWAKQGVSGFRCDAVRWLSKNPSLADDSRDGLRRASSFGALEHNNSQGWRRLHTYLKMVDDKAGSVGLFLLHEVYPNHKDRVEEYAPFYRNGRPNARPMMTGLVDAHWNVTKFRLIIDTFQKALRTNDVPSYVLGNHDKSRVATRVKPENAKAAMTMLLTLPGQPVIFNGDELGMTDTKIPKNKARDPIGRTLNNPKAARDPERTPMQWTSGRNAGFSTASAKNLWLPVNKNYKNGINVTDEAADPHSILNHTRNLLKLRRNNLILREGQYRSYYAGHGGVLAFERVLDNQKVLVLINFSKKRLPLRNSAGAVILSSTERTIDKDYLAPHEARVLQII